MKLPWVAFSAFVLLAGCAQPAAIGSAFDTMADAAPALLLADQGAGGTMSRAETEATVASVIHTEDGDMDMEMGMAITQEFFTGGSTLMSMSYTEFTLDGQDASDLMGGLQITLFCSPSRLVLRSTGFEEIGTDDFNVDIENPRATCDPPAPGEEVVPQEFLVDVSPQAREMLSSLAQQVAAKPMTYLRQERDGGEVVAVYDQDLDLGMEGVEMDFEVSVRGHLEGARLVLVEMEASGTLAMAMMGQEVTAEMDMTSSTEYSYGTRAPVPREFA